MRRRAELIEETRLRIVEAAVRLHARLGPMRTSMAAIAAEAGVTRETLYRHFAGEAELFEACSAHWLTAQKMPDLGAWATISDPFERLRFGLTDLYRFFRDGEPMLRVLYRDYEFLPAVQQRVLREQGELCQRLLAEAFPRAQRGARLGALVGHAVSFSTWRSLCLDQGLSDQDAARMMTELAGTAAKPQVAVLKKRDPE